MTKHPKKAVLSKKDIQEIAVAIRERNRNEVRRWLDRLPQLDDSTLKHLGHARLSFAVGDFEIASREFDFAAVGATGGSFCTLNDVGMRLKLARLLSEELDRTQLLQSAIIDPRESIDLSLASDILRAADEEFIYGSRDIAASIYDVLEQQGYRSPEFSTGRHGEALLSAGKVERAFSKLAESYLRDELQEWSLVAYADAAMRLGKPDLASEVFARVQASGHRSIYFLERYVDHLIAQGKFEEGLSYVDAADLTQIPGDVVARARALLLIAANDLQALYGLNEQLTDVTRDLIGDRLAAAGYAVLAAGSVDGVNQLERFLRGFHSRSPGLCFLKIDLAFRAHDFQYAESVIDQASELLAGSDLELLLLKRAELSAFRGDISSALGTIGSMDAADQLPSAMLGPIATIYAEAKASDQLVSLVRERLETWFNFDSHGTAVLAAIATTDRWEELFEIVEGSLARAPSEHVLKLRAVAMERVAGVGRLSLVLEDEPAQSQDRYRKRFIARARALAGSERDRETSSAFAAEHAVVYCTDAGYLSAAFNSISSLLVTNSALFDQTAIYLYVDHADLGIAAPIAAALSEHYGVAIEVEAADELISGFGGKLRTDYGLFTGGMQLSASAYYRIFAIKRILEREAKSKLLYIDSDTLVVGDVARVFALLDGEAPLHARREVAKFEVNRVEALHGLASGTYFNSGVLAVDLKHDDIVACLSQTISAVEKHSERLVYHDQCALNLGFKGRAAALPTAFNSFVTSRDDVNSAGAGGVVLHFLDRPKPWQAGYEGAFGPIWYRYWEVLAGCVPRALLTALVERSPI